MGKPRRVSPDPSSTCSYSRSHTSLHRFTNYAMAGWDNAQLHHFAMFTITKRNLGEGMNSWAMLWVVSIHAVSRMTKVTSPGVESPLTAMTPLSSQLGVLHNSQLAHSVAVNNIRKCLKLCWVSGLCYFITNA